jgi:hypothetical protein
MPYYGPDESAETIFLERTFVAGDFISGVGYGEWALGLVKVMKLNQADTMDRCSASAVYFLCALLMESKKNTQAIHFSSRVHYAPPYSRDHIHGCASEHRAIHIH